MSWDNNSPRREEDASSEPRGDITWDCKQGVPPAGSAVREEQCRVLDLSAWSVGLPFDRQDDAPLTRAVPSALEPCLLRLVSSWIQSTKIMGPQFLEYPQAGKRRLLTLHSKCHKCMGPQFLEHPQAGKRRLPTLHSKCHKCHNESVTG